MALNKILILYVMVYGNIVYKAAISIIKRLMQWDTTAED